MIFYLLDLVALHLQRRAHLLREVLFSVSAQLLCLNRVVVDVNGEVREGHG